MKKGFTLVELLGVIVILAIISGIAVVSISFLIDRGRKEVYLDYEKTLESGAQNYLVTHLDKLPTISTPTSINYTDLMNDDASYKSLKDPRGGSCNNSYILVTRASTSEHEINFDLDYKVCLVCDTYKSNGC